MDITKERLVEILQIMLARLERVKKTAVDDLDSPFSGLCNLVNRLAASYWVPLEMIDTTSVQWHEVFDVEQYIMNNKPLSLYRIFRKGKTHYHFHPYAISPRIKWLKKHIKLNQR